MRLSLWLFRWRTPFAYIRFPDIIGIYLTGFSSLSEAASKMVRIQSVTEPRRESVPVYEGLFARFVEELRRRGYI